MTSYNEHEILSMVLVAFKLRMDLFKQSQNTKAKMNDDNCMQCVPELSICSSRCFSVLLEGFDDDEPVYVVRKRKVLNVGQDLLYAVTIWKIIPAKQ